MWAGATTRELAANFLLTNRADAHTQHKSHKHFSYIFVNKISYFFSKSGDRFEIWTLLFFLASFDLSNLRGQIEKL
jgi:hypothetical protein